MRYQSLALISAALFCHGCVSSTAQGALWGAGSGAVAGLAIGHAASDEDLLGAPVTDQAGDMSLDPWESRLAGLVVGTVFGAIVGGIFGHVSENPLQDNYDAEQATRAQTLSDLDDLDAP